MEVTRYAIIDGAIEEGLMEFLETINPPHCCLYAEPIQPDLVALAPYIVEATGEVNEWLNGKSTPWGIFLTSKLSMQKLQQHFRQYLWVNIPEQSKPVLFRFYDPRNIWTLLSILSPAELNKFTEPVTKITTRHGGINHEENFSSFLQRGKSRVTGTINSHLCFTIRQHTLLNRQAQSNYIKTLSQYICNYHTKKNLSFREEHDKSDYYAENYFYFCKSLDINDDRSIRALTYLLLENKIHDIEGIPYEWIDQLKNNDMPPHRNVERLLLQKLGFFPQ